MFKRLYQWLFSSLAHQLLITYLLIITIALLALSIWAILLIRSESITDLRNSLEVDAVNLATEIDNDLMLDSEKSRARIRAAADRHATKLGVQITVVDTEGHVVADSGGSIEANTNISNQAEINDALAGIPAIIERYSQETHSDWLFITYPIRGPGHTTGVIRVALQLTDMYRRLSSDAYIFLRIIAATAVVMIVFSVWLSRRINQPLKDMSAMAKNIALSGDMSEFVPVARRDEIGELGHSFNQMVSRLREQERLRQEFIANASHELKTPTMAIGSVVEALQAGAAEDPKLRAQFLDSLERLVERQSSLLQDLLDVSRLDSQRDVKWADDVNLLQVISDAVDHVRPAGQKKAITLEYRNAVETDREIVTAGNAIQLQRALVNILTNAINYTPAQGTINVTTRLPDQDLIEIRIQDSGIGIDPADLPHIFERFYRADKARTRTSGGTGLGLAITQEIITRHTGRIEVESTVGKGSVFSVFLPLKPLSTGLFKLADGQALDNRTAKRSDEVTVDG